MHQPVSFQLITFTEIIDFRKLCRHFEICIQNASFIIIYCLHLPGICIKKLGFYSVTIDKRCCEVADKRV